MSEHQNRRPGASGPENNPRSRPAARTAPRVAASRPASKPAPARSRKKKKVNPLLMVLAAAAAVLAAVFGGIGRLFSAANHKLDFLRRGEVRTVVVNAALGGAAVFIALCVLMAFRPAINSARARSAASSGDVENALRIVASLQSGGASEERMDGLRRDVAEGFIRSGEYAAARSVIAGLPQDDAAAALSSRVSYAEASALYDSGDYSAAAQLFYPLAGYQDSASRYADCRCALAVQAYMEGQEASARSLLLDVPDVAARVAAVAETVAGSRAQEVLAAGLFQPDNLNHLEETMAGLASARSDLPRGRIAAGKMHTVGLRADGTVLAAGDNSFGQSSVGGWTDITQLAAGAIHTVGLRADGTVVACGDNSSGQCDVSGWTDIVAVAAASFDTIGLKSDGTVVAAGMHAAKVSGWHNATFVTGGSYSLACLYDKGTMLSSHAAAQMDLSTTLYDLSVCGPVSVGVLYDGTLVSTFDGAPDWTEIVTAVATETGVLAIDVSGSVRTHFYRAGDSVAVNPPEPAAELASSGTHHVVLTTSGAVYAYGSNASGQCEVDGWALGT